MKKIINWLVDKYVLIKFWVDQTILEKDLDRELQYYTSMQSQVIFDSETQRKYSEGLSTVKQKINQASKRGSKEDYREALESMRELIALANNETVSQRVLRKTLERMYVHYGSDVKSNRDKVDMIDTRIGHYEELRKYNIERRLLKGIKKARKDGNEELALRLESDWREQYGKTRDGRRR